MRDPDTQYDTAKRSAAANIAVLRAAVAAYLIYLGYTLIRDAITGVSTMAPALAWAAGLLFIAAAAVFGLYTWRRWCADMERAKLPPPGEDRDTEA